MNVLVVGLNHRTAPVEIRERFAISATTIAPVLEELKNEVLREVVILSTCNRVEIYTVCTHTPDAVERIFLTLEKRFGMALDRNHFYVRELGMCIQHLFEVSSGLDSMVVGETEILGQVKEAYRIAHEAHRTGLGLNKLFQNAFAVAKEIRSRTRIGMGSVSVGSVAVDLASQIFGNLESRTILLVGAGEMGEATAKAFHSRGAKSLLVTNRSRERAEKLATPFNGKTVPWETWREECRQVDVVVSSTSAPSYILTREDLVESIPHRNGTPLFLIDIAVPRNIARDVTELEGVYLYDMDDLQLIADHNLAQRQKEITVCKQIVRSHTDKFETWFMQKKPQLAMCPTARKLEGWRKAVAST